MTEKKGRIRYIDLARSIAIISISFNHAVNRSFRMDNDTMGQFIAFPLWKNILKAVFYGFSRIGVPLFLMISGALLLSRDYEGDGWKKFIRKNWLPLFITTEIWLVIMFWYKQILPGSILAGAGWGQCLLKFFLTILFINPTTMGSMWYMEMILCAYLLIPVLSIAMKRLPPKYFILPCVIIVICSYILPDINGALTAAGISLELKSKLSSANVFSMYFVYILLGHYINQGLLDKVKKIVLLCTAACSFIIFCVLQSWVWSTPYEYEFGKHYKDVFILTTSLPVFELLRRTNVRDLVAKISHKLAEISFGIYFVHICIMEGLKLLLKLYAPAVNGHLFMRMFILEVVSVGGAILIIQLLRRFRFCRKYVFGIKS